MKRNIVSIDESKCDGCGLCIPSCKEGALQIVNGKAKLVSDIYCDGLGACLGNCPRDAIKIETREAHEFNEEAVNKRLQQIQPQQAHHNHGSASTHSHEKELPCGCPGTMAKTLQKKSEPSECPSSCASDSSGTSSRQISNLQNWPVQLRLVPTSAPYLKNAHLLISADCVPFSYANFHNDFVKGRVVLIGCPKLDDNKFYREKLTEIFSNMKPLSVKVLKMEVPCCTGIAQSVIDARNNSGSNFELEVVTITLQGEIQDRLKL
ncbi:MAG: 4Fe-4S binding protein [Candidatus Riflebacteria bacterium]|nr:4Fe-4S binding protein [Candidatus Riflebacteria bacterium]